jgi:hypothetical protein
VSVTRILTASLAAFSVAAHLGTLRTVMYAAAVQWLPEELRDGTAARAAIERAVAVDGY